MRVAVVSDTHVPSRAAGIPEWVEREIAAADHAVHVGDFDSPDAYETVAELAGEEFTAVAGNMDPASLGLPETATVELGGVTFVAVHGTGALDSYEQRVADTVRDEGGADAVGLCGHTHDVMDDEHDGVRLLNPGSATGASPADDPTMMVADAAGGDLDVTVKRE